MLIFWEPAERELDTQGTSERQIAGGRWGSLFQGPRSSQAFFAESLPSPRTNTSPAFSSTEMRVFVMLSRFLVCCRRCRGRGGRGGAGRGRGGRGGCMGWGVRGPGGWWNRRGGFLRAGSGLGCRAARGAGEAGEAGGPGPGVPGDVSGRTGGGGSRAGSGLAGPSGTWPGPNLFSRRCSGPIECPGQAAKGPAARFSIDELLDHGLVKSTAA